MFFRLARFLVLLTPLVMTPVAPSMAFADAQESALRLHPEATFFALGLLVALASLVVCLLLKQRRTEIAFTEKESETRFRELFDASIDGIVIAEMNGSIIDANPAFLDLLGCRNLAELPREISLSPDTPEVSRSGWPNPETEEEPQQAGAEEVLREYVRADGERILVGLHVRSRRNAEGKPIGLWALVRDNSSRKKTEDALHKNMNLLRNIIDSSSDLIFVKNLNRETILCNEACMRNIVNHFDSGNNIPSAEGFPTGLDHEDLSALEGRTSRFSISIPIDGALRVFDVTKRPLVDDSGNIIGLLGIAHDSTEYRLAAKALEESRQKLSAILDSMDDAIYSLDAESLGLIQTNSAISEIFGLPQEAFYENSARYLLAVHPDDRTATEQLMLRIRELKEIDTTYRIIRPDGEVRWITDRSRLFSDEWGKPIRIDHIFSDITEKKAAEDAMLEAWARYERIVNFMKSGVIICRGIDDGNDYIIDEFSPAAEKISRLERTSAIGKRLVDCFPGVAELGFPNLMRNVFLTGIPEEIRRGYYHDNKRRGWRDYFIYRLPTDEIVILYDNITEQVEAEEDNQRLEIQLRQAQKLEAVGTLAGGIAHDFNNILSPIIGYTEMVVGGLAQEDINRQDLLQVLFAAYRAKELVKQILAFSHLDEEQLKSPVEIGAIIKEVMKLLRASLPSTIRIKQNIAQGVVLADSTQIHQVVVNLCTNAAHAMEDRGVLGVEFGEVELTERDVCALSLTGIEPGIYLKLSVSDTGHGMDEATMERIFDPYFTTKKIGKGSGLGLSVVHGIVKRHDGTVSVRSRPGEGSTFSVFLPKALAASSAPGEDTSELATGSEKILIVDDERIVLEPTEKILRKLGYRTAAYTNPAEAFAVFKSTPEDFDLLLTDYTMPNMTGLELVAQIRTLRPHMPVILVTGYSDRISEEAVEDLGIEFSMKPLEMGKMSETVRRTLDAAKERRTVD